MENELLNFLNIQEDLVDSGKIQTKHTHIPVPGNKSMH